MPTGAPLINNISSISLTLINCARAPVKLLFNGGEEVRDAVVVVAVDVGLEPAVEELVVEL